MGVGDNLAHISGDSSLVQRVTGRLAEATQVRRVTGLGFNVRVSACCDCLTESLLTSIM